MSDNKLTARQLYDLSLQVDQTNRTAQRIGDVMAAAEKKKRMRRFTWVRAANDVYDDDRWRLVARMAGAPLYLVEAMVLRLDLYANKNKPRGSLEGFSIAALAARWSFPNEDTLARIYAALEHPEIAWVEQDHLVTFWERNPDTDATAKDRMQRWRARKKVKDSVTRNDRNVTRRTDQTFTNSSDQSASSTAAGLSEGAGGKVVPSGIGESGDIDPELWIVTEGVRIVTEQLQENRSLAELKITRWRDQELGGDAAALKAIILSAAKTDLFGARFLNLIVDQLKRHAAGADGQRTLPLPPAPVKDRRAG